VTTPAATKAGRIDGRIGVEARSPDRSSGIRERLEEQGPRRWRIPMDKCRMFLIAIAKWLRLMPRILWHALAHPFAASKIDYTSGTIETPSS